MRVKIKVTPNSGKDEIIEGTPLLVRVTDSPEKDKANKKVLRLLSEYVNKKVLLVSGAKSRKKFIELLE